MAAIPLALLIGSVLSSTAVGATGDGTLRLRWTAITDLQNLYARALRSETMENVAPNLPDQVNLELVLLAGAARLSSSLAVEQGGTAGDASRRSAEWTGVPAGDAWLELSEVGGPVLRRWALSITPETTTEAALDLGTLTLDLRIGAGAPFGQWQAWSARELARVPGAGEESIRRLDPQGPAVANLDGATIGLAGRLRPRIVNLEATPLSYGTPLGATSAALVGFEPWVVTQRTPASGLPDLALSYMGGAAARHRAALRAGVRRDTPLPSLGLLGPIEATADLQLETSGDAGPLGIASEKLEHNQWDAATARLDLRLRPGGVPAAGAPISRGLARLAFYASADKREYALAEFNQDIDHAPLEKRADVSLRGAYDFVFAGVDLSAAAGFRRSFLETGDGDAFDLFDEYRILGGNTAVTADGLYWQGANAQGGAGGAHIWNYYLRDLTTGTSVSLEGARAFGRHQARAGIERRGLTWRTFEHLDPISSFRGASGGGFEYANNLGYSVDGDAQAERPGAGARHPVWASAFVTDRWSAGRLAVELGLRAERFRAGQNPLRNLDAPSGADTLLDTSDLGNNSAEKSVEPRIGLALSVNERTEAWADFGVTRVEPPFEARHYAPALLQALDLHAREGQMPIARDFVFGNPDLEAARLTRVHLGIRRRMAERWDVQLAGQADRTEDAWVARAHTVGRGQLLFYENGRTETAQALIVDALWHRGPTSRVRLLYRLGRDRTDHLEPVPMLRALRNPDLPAMNAGSYEAWLGDGLWIDDGIKRDAFPSLNDRTHRLALVYETTIAPGSAFGSLLPLVDFTVAARVASGLPYTPTYTRSEGAIENLRVIATPVAGARYRSKRTAGAFQLDAALAREMEFFHRRLELKVEGRNLLDQRTPRLVYGATGEADDDGFLKTEAGRAQIEERGASFREAYLARIENPLAFEEGITLRGGVTLRY